MKAQSESVARLDFLRWQVIDPESHKFALLWALVGSSSGLIWRLLPMSFEWLPLAMTVVLPFQ